MSTGITGALRAWLRAGEHELKVTFNQTAQEYVVILFDQKEFAGKGRDASLKPAILKALLDCSSYGKVSQ